MKITNLLCLFVLSVGFTAVAAPYDCTVAKLAVSGEAKEIGRMSLKAGSGLQTVEINDQHDYAACGIFIQDDIKEIVGCTFAPKTEEIKVLRSFRGLPRLARRNRVTGELTMASVAATEATGSPLILAIPLTKTDLYVSYCLVSKSMSRH